MHWPKRIDHKNYALTVIEWRSWEFNFLKWLNIGYICYIHCPVLILYIHHVAHQGNKVIISKA